MFDDLIIDAWDSSNPTGIRPLEAILTEAQNELAYAQRRRHSEDVVYLRKLTEVATFLQGVYSGKIPTSRFIEAMSTSDFPILIGDVLDRQLLSGYSETPVTWPEYLSRSTVDDFRAVRLITLDGLEQPYYPTYKKAELEDVKEDNSLTEGQYSTKVEVYEKGFSLNWRMLVNRALNAFANLPQRLARGARRTEQKFASGLYQDSSGPLSTFFTSGNKNQIITANGAASNNPPLSVQGLKDGLNVFYRMVDSGGDPIAIEGAILVVPPTLAFTAEEILKANSLSFNPGTSSGISFGTANWLGPRLRLVIDWYAPVINTTSGHTAWYLFASPAARPAATVTFLKGYETPSLYRKAPNTERLGGGVDPTLGDYEDGEIRYKGMHIIGGSLIDPKAAVASNGTGS
jgi:hypothetical protein